MQHHRHRLRALRQFSPSLVVAGIELDRNSGVARRAGRYLRLCEAEIHLLDLFMSNPGATFGRERLVAHLWGRRADIYVRTVDVYIGRLRKALTLGRAPNPILSVRGKGYQFSANAERDYARWTEEGPDKLRLRTRPHSRAMYFVAKQRTASAPHKIKRRGARTKPP